MLKVKSRTYTTEEELRIIKSNFLCNDHCKLSVDDLATYLKKHPMTIRSMYKKLKNDINYTTYKFKEDYFEVIDHEKKAYWLGFLCADGCIASDRDRVHITLSDRDYNHLIKLKLVLGLKHEIRRFESMCKDYKQPSKKCSLQFGSIKLVKDLIRHGCVRHKTQDLKFPESLVVSMIPHWIRGFVDGDGSFNMGGGYLGFSVCGTFDVINNINLYLDLNLKINQDKRTPNLYYIQTRKYSNLVKIAYSLYDGAETFLERKREKLNDILGSINAY